jgi:RNA polymerase sigma-70 factor (ECF subfamily)
MKPRELQDLIAAAIAGDQAALQKLLVSQRAAVTRYAERRLPASIRDHVDSDDVVQQTFVEAFRSIARFRLDESPRFQAWLFGTADNVIRDMVKRQGRAKRGGGFRRIRRANPTDSQSVADLIELITAGSHSPSRSAMGHEAVAAVTKAIEELPDDYRQAVELRLLDGMSLEETAAIMDRSPRAVQGLVDRAKNKLRAVLGTLSNYK